MLGCRYRPLLLVGPCHLGLHEATAKITQTIPHGLYPDCTQVAPFLLIRTINGSNPNLCFRSDTALTSSGATSSHSFPLPTVHSKSANGIQPQSKVLKWIQFKYRVTPHRGQQPQLWQTPVDPDASSLCSKGESSRSLPSFLIMFHIGSS